MAFEIEDVDDYGQYGLDDPECTITLETDDETYEISLGDYSTMDHSVMFQSEMECVPCEK